MVQVIRYLKSLYWLICEIAFFVLCILSKGFPLLVLFWTVYDGCRFELVVSSCFYAMFCLSMSSFYVGCFVKVVLYCRLGRFVANHGKNYSDQTRGEKLLCARFL